MHSQSTLQRLLRGEILKNTRYISLESLEQIMMTDSLFFVEPGMSISYPQYLIKISVKCHLEVCPPRSQYLLYIEVIE
jgi:hypothetical protein